MQKLITFTERAITEYAHHTMRTISYAYDLVEMQMLCKHLNDAGHNLESSGSPIDLDGHILTIKIDGITHFWASMHSNKKHYMVRATPALIQLDDNQ